ncbi:hypothetical protein [Dactylosporangium sp. NPDC049140]|uniref:hypothetical protein n=1 Tax=Dactylosporangium sp. NPDC049140 TaxID=3155647 RepID=UPI0033E24C77
MSLADFALYIPAVLSAVGSAAVGAFARTWVKEHYLTRRAKIEADKEVQLALLNGPRPQPEPKALPQTHDELEPRRPDTPKKKPSAA